MESKHKIDHTQDGFRQALGIDAEKVQITLQHLQKFGSDRAGHVKKSEVLEEVSKLGNDPVEIAYLAYHLGRMEGEFELGQKAMIQQLLSGILGDQERRGRE